MDYGGFMEGVSKEWKILECRVGGSTYGIDLGCVAEIIPYQKPRVIPKAHSYIEGVIMPRDILLPVLDTAKCLHQENQRTNGNGMLIIVSFHEINLAFHVEGVSQIHKITTTDIMEPDDELSTTNEAAIAGILDFGNKKIEILDIENIVNQIQEK